MKKYTKWAVKLDGTPIHISEADSGSNNYFCGGCKSRKIAHPNNVKQEPFFRHHPQDFHLHHKKCPFGDESMRHKAAKDIIQILRRIKVPSIKIPVPEQFGGGDYMLEPAKFVEAEGRVFIEHYLSFNRNGTVEITHNIPDSDFYIKPDVIFTDFQDRPILIIEIRATHKVDSEKRAKIIFFGIDCVEVKVPENYNKEDIQNYCLESVKNTVWLYNEKQLTTSYDPNTHPIGTGRFDDPLKEGEPDFEETFECAKFGIKEALRAIGRVMESAQYRKAANLLEEEESRIKREERELEAEERAIEIEEREFSVSTESVGEEERALEEEVRREVSRRIAERHRQLEGRYQREKERLRSIQLEQGREREDFESTRRRIEVFRESYRDDLNNLKRRIEENKRRREELPGQFEQDKDSTSRRSEVDKARERAEIKRIASEERALPEEFRRKEEQVDQDFEGLRGRADEIINSKDTSGDSELSKRIKRLLDARELYNVIQEEEKSFIRYRTAYKSFTEGTFKNWKEFQ